MLSLSQNRGHCMFAIVKPCKMFLRKEINNILTHQKRCPPLDEVALHNVHFQEDHNLYFKVKVCIGKFVFLCIGPSADRPHVCRMLLSKCADKSINLTMNALLLGGVKLFPCNRLLWGRTLNMILLYTLNKSSFF